MSEYVAAYGSGAAWGITQGRIAELEACIEAVDAAWWEVVLEARPIYSVGPASGPLVRVPPSVTRIDYPLDRLLLSLRARLASLRGEG